MSQSLLYSCCIYFQITYSLCYIIDYFSEDFNTYKNCKNKEQFLSQVKTNQDYCTSYTIIERDDYDIGLKFELCQKDLSYKLKEGCAGLRVKNTGILSYCISKGTLNCCFSNHSCQSWKHLNEHFGQEAVKYINNRTHYLQQYLVKNIGYKTCHHLRNYDATLCSNDCNLFEKSNFSKTCSEHFGVFKCCIRRDSVCDQCKFCCTLPMCTQSNNITTFDMVNHFKITSSGRNYKNAKEIYSTETFLYKNDDYRCLKPNSDKNPEKWKYYDMPKFRAAMSKRELLKVPTYKFNKYFFNYFDRHTLKKFLSPKGNKLMKRTYGFDYCAKVPKLNVTKCSIQCIKAKKSKFAMDCEKKKGLFKCCVSRWITKPFEDINRKNWLEMGLKKKPPKKCLEDNSYKDCSFCCVTYACTKWDNNKEKSITTFKTNLKPGQRAGGFREGIGFRYTFCAEQDYCTEFLNWEYYIPQYKYDEAINSTDICQLPTKQLYLSFNNTDEKDKYKQMKNARKEKCLKDIKHSPFSRINVKTCSPSNLKLKSNQLKFTNKKLRKIIKQQKIKKHKKSKKCGRKKNNGKCKKDAKTKRKGKKHNGKKHKINLKKSNTQKCGRNKHNGKCKKDGKNKIKSKKRNRNYRISHL